MSRRKKLLLICGTAVVTVALFLGVEYGLAWRDYQSPLAFPAAEQAEVVTLLDGYCP